MYYYGNHHSDSDDSEQEHKEYMSQFNRSLQFNNSTRVIDSQEFRCYSDMIARCTNPTHKFYEQWNGPDNPICNEWYISYSKFLYDMGEIPINQTKHSLERLDKTKPYCKENCKWMITNAGLHFKLRRASNEHPKIIIPQPEITQPQTTLLETLQLKTIPLDTLPEYPADTPATVDTKQNIEQQNNEKQTVKKQMRNIQTFT